MENTQDFLNKLDKLTFIKHENKTLHTAQGFEISHTIELIGNPNTDYPIQFLFRIRKDDVHVARWGCSSNEDNKLAVHWWLQKYYAISDMEYEEKNIVETLAKIEFENLTK